MVPFLDLNKQYKGIQKEITDSLMRVLEISAFAGGPVVAEFEKEFARYCQCRYASGVSSGTEALWAVLVCLGIGQGDEVITVPNTFIATTEAISFSGAKPVLVDIDEDTYTLDPALLESSITECTKAIIPVHLYGQTADMDPILSIAKKYNLWVIEDACQAHGSQYKNRVAGSMGIAGCFSFYPGKNLGAYGDAGGIVTNDKELYEKLQKFRDHGQEKKYYHSMIGWNARMDGFQAAVLNVKLNYLPAWTDLRRQHAQQYIEQLKEIDEIRLPIEKEWNRHVYHVFPIQVQQRDKLMSHMDECGVKCGIHYPIPIHRQKAYEYMNLPEGSYPIAENCAKELLSLPMFPELTELQIKQVIEGIKSFYVNRSMVTLKTGTDNI